MNHNLHRHLWCHGCITYETNIHDTFAPELKGVFMQKSKHSICLFVEQSFFFHTENLITAVHMGFHMGYYYRLPLNTLEVFKWNPNNYLTIATIIHFLFTMVFVMFIHQLLHFPPNLQYNTIAISYAILYT